MARLTFLLALAAEATAQLGVDSKVEFYCSGQYGEPGATNDDLDLCFPEAPDVEVMTVNGPIVGKSYEGISRFYGVEYADSSGAVETPRFKYPLPLTSWTTPKPAKQIKHCWATEDCLKLNIATPTNMIGATDLLPVMVYFHGGGFYAEGNNAGLNMDMAYHAKFGIDPSDSASPGKAVFVFPHYRLGPLGFLSHPGFGRANGMFGLADGIEALRWVQANIAFFGGNKDMVSITGSSAGGGYVSMILASPRSVGLINNVISLSPYVSYHPAAYSQTARMEFGMMYFYATGCATSFAVPTGAEAEAQAGCLRDDISYETMFGSTPAYGFSAYSMMCASTFTQNSSSAPYCFAGPFNGALTAAWETYMGQPGLWSTIYFNFGVHPVVDGYILEEPPTVAYKKGFNSGVTVIFGHMANEYSLIFGSPNTLYPYETYFKANLGWQIGIKDLPLTATNLEMYSAIWGGTPDIETVTRIAYPGFGDPTTSWHTNIQSVTDVFFTWGIKMATDALIEGTSMKVYKALNTLGAPESMMDVAGTVPYDFRAYMGAFHAIPWDNAKMGFYLWKSSISATPGGYNYNPYLAGSVTPWSTSEIAVARAMSTHVKNVIMGNLPDASGIPWPANSPATMVYSPAFESGAAFGQCIRIHASAAGCVTETTSPFRGTQIAYFENPSMFTEVMTTGSCDVPFLYAEGGASGEVSGTFGLTLPHNLSSVPYSCSACRCSAGRQILFGAPSISESSCRCE